jgi:hypothetical protein
MKLLGDGILTAQFHTNGPSQQDTTTTTDDDAF